MCLPQQGFQSGIDLRHTGEFHDCIPLPIFETPNVVSSKNFQTAKVSERRTTDPWLAVEADRHQGFTVDPDTSIRFVAESSTQRPTVVYAIETKLPFIPSSFSFLPCFVRVGSVVNEPRNVAGPTENTRDLDLDDLVREPLALDDGPKASIVIEEILDDDDEKEETSRCDRNDNEMAIDERNDRSSDDQVSTNSSVKLTDDVTSRERGEDNNEGISRSERNSDK